MNSARTICLRSALTPGHEIDKSEPYVLRVSDAGAVEVPLVGQVQVAGVQATEAGRRIVAASRQRGVYRQPQVTVEVKERASNEVVVLGAVGTPGMHKLPRGGCDVVSALAAAGGMTEDADPEVEVLRRGFGQSGEAPLAATGGVEQASFNAPPGPRSPKIQRINLARPDRLTAEQRRLGDRDVVMVRPREKEVIHVSGLVRQPDQFELPAGKDIRLLDALAMAGGERRRWPTAST